MAEKITRKIIKIDEDKCDGCGNCVISCAEGALKIIDGKAKLISENYCDGLGACLGECPQGAISIEERTADAFDEEAAMAHVKASEETLACGCPSTVVEQFEKKDVIDTGGSYQPKSTLEHWPVQLTLVPPTAPFLKGTDLLLTGDCVPFAYADFHRKFLKGHALLVACPKLDNFDAHLERLTDILKQAEPRSITVVHMEVMCCSGLNYMAKQAISASGRDFPFDEVTITAKGEIKA